MTYGTYQDWKEVRNFDKKEWRTNPDAVDLSLVWMVDRLTTRVKSMFPQAVAIVHVAFESSDHAEDSKHYKGEAVDLHFAGVPLIAQYMIATEFPFTGIGVYPFWNNPGLHLELAKDEINAWRSKRWWRDKKGNYRGLTEREFLQALGASV